MEEVEEEISKIEEEQNEKVSEKGKRIKENKRIEEVVECEPKVDES